MEELLLKTIEPLLTWYRHSARILPWRESPEPYRVWVSEVMLQQTRVEAVKPYFERFLSQLPTVEALAAAPEAQILKLWEGLGYYNRVRNLQKGAREVINRFSGIIPASYSDLLTLPGVGSYTAGAIASIAFGIPVPAVDGNVLRVTARVCNYTGNVLNPKVKREIETALSSIMPKDRAGDFNQALMELGAVVCVPNGAPHCGNCPLESLCRARQLGIQETLPVKSAKKDRKSEHRTVFLLTCDGKLALRRRPEHGLLAGLWELPAQAGILDECAVQDVLRDWGIVPFSLTRLQDARHIFTHLEWHMAAWAVETSEESPDFLWATQEELSKDYTLPSAFKAYFTEIDSRLSI